MNRAACPVDELELIALSDGELTENRARELREHLQPGPAGCARCAGRLARLEALATQLRAPVAGASDASFVDEVERRLPAARGPRAASGRSWSRRGLALTALAGTALAAAVILVVVPARLFSPPEFAPRGTPAAWHALVSRSLDIVSARPAPGAPLSRPLAPGERMRPGDGIAVSAHNGHRELPVYLMVFAVDAGGEVHWIVPAWTDPSDTPRAILLRPGAELPEPAGRTPEGPAPGKLRVSTLLLRAPLDVRAVEAAVQAGRPLAPAGDRHLETVVLEMAKD
jgi:anti-sigma factor RsiW